MNELNKYLESIRKLYNSNLSNSEKSSKLSTLWTDYYKKSHELGIDLDEAYNLYLLGENESYIIDAIPLNYDISDLEITICINKLKEALKYKTGITKEEAFTILKWDILNARRGFKTLGINMEKDSLNGFCELGQALTIMPLENIGLKVTKNKAKDCFDYNHNHAFGTVTLPIIINNQVINKTYLIDSTYRQFFTTTRCNLGRYYAKDPDLGIPATPDPGYFVTDTDFAKNLIKTGFCELNSDTAQKYGEAFYLSSLDKNMKKQDINYYQSIKNNTSNYVLNVNELEYLNIDFPNSSTLKRKI